MTAHEGKLLSLDLNLKHLALIIVLLALLLSRPLIPSSIADSVVLLTMIFSAWLAGGNSRRALIAAIGAGLASIAVVTFDIVAHYHVRDFVRQPAGFAVAATILLLLFYSGAVILHSLVKVERVFVNEILGAFNMYLIMGFAWSYAYGLVELWAPGSFQWPDSESSLGLQLTYFSFVTLTTVGFGDVLPVSSTAKMLVILEAIIGQFYVAVVVAYLVSMYITHKIAFKHEKE
jgi:hypothetical protein